MVILCMSTWTYTYTILKENWGIFLRIRYRNIVRDSNGVITSGSAALVENKYLRNASGDRSRNHTQQTVVERLGKVVWINDNDSQHGIFDSPSRGLVSYSVKQDEFIPVEPTDTRISGTQYEQETAWIHVNFGNAFLFFNELEKTPFMNVVRSTFTDPVLYEKVLAHLAHDCLKNGSSIKCGEFLKSSMLSHALKNISVSTLDCDSSYFFALANDNLKKEFFKNLIAEMRKTHPDFGRCCYTDSTPLPGEAEDNPFNALSSHGTDGAVIQSRLVLLLDIQTCIPVWFEIIASNVLDKSTILTITHDVKATLDLDIDVYDLDAGYARQELFQLFNRKNNTRIDEKGIIRERTVLVRMPDIKGYGRDDLYMQCKPHFYTGRYSFDYEHHTYFGERIEIELFGQSEYAFVFIDKTQAESLLREWRTNHQEEWEGLTDLQQDWYQVKDGFFILIGNKDQSPKDTLIEYRGRARIELFFRDGKSYLKILPIAKWNKQTVTGKIFHDIIETMFYRGYRKRISATGMTMSSLIVSLDGWEACKLSNGLLEIKTPSAQVRDICEKLGYAPPGHMSLEDFSKQVLKGTQMSLDPVTQRSNRKPKPNDSTLSPEEKRDSVKQKQIERLIAKEMRKKEAVEKRATNIRSKAEQSAELKRKKALDKAKKKVRKTLAEAKRESTRNNALDVYRSELDNIKKEYELSITVAKNICDKTLADAQAAFDSAVSDIKNRINESKDCTG